MISKLDESDLIKINEIRKKFCSPERIILRRQAEDLAIAIVDSTIPGCLELDDIENVLRLMNYDYWGKKVHYSRFDQTFLGQNMNLILSNNIDSLNKSFMEIYWKENLTVADKLRKQIAGAKFGFMTTLLYLKNREKYNIFLNKLEEGILTLYPHKKFSDNFYKKYIEYNDLVNELKGQLKIASQEIDIILASLAK